MSSCQKQYENKSLPQGGAEPQRNWRIVLDSRAEGEGCSSESSQKVGDAFTNAVHALVAQTLTIGLALHSLSSDLFLVLEIKLRS